MADITYCSSDCPFTDCERHRRKVTKAAKDGKVYVSVADLAPICRRYIASVIEEVIKNG